MYPTSTLVFRALYRKRHVPSVELLDMFCPAAAAEIEAARGEVTSVDFGALEPPQAG